MPEPSTFTGEIKVASRIVDYLSSGLYKDPAACLKELVNNAYDADATSVSVFVKPDADRIIIEDDGEGITRSDFVRHFDRVSESRKRESSDRTASGRPKIGLIGIGFIAANEICDEMEIFSTTEGSKELLHVTIDFAAMRRPMASRRSKSGDISKADYVGEVLDAPKEEHYTQLFLKRVRGQAQEILAGVGGRLDTEGRSLYGASEETFSKSLQSDMRSWADRFDPYSWTMLQVGLNVPVAYISSWTPPQCESTLADVTEKVEALNFEVHYDGTPLRKPIVFPDRKTVCESIKYEGEHVAYQGYLIAQHGALKPQDLNGVLVRIRNAAVGEYRSDFLSFPSSRYTLFQKWVSVELYADDRLEEALNIDRRTLRDTHPAFVELRDSFHEHLDRFLERVRRVLYEEPAAERREERSRKTASKITVAIDSMSTELSDGQVKTIRDEFEQRLADDKFRQALSRQYTAGEIYGLVVEIASEILAPSESERFIRELTRRIG